MIVVAYSACYYGDSWDKSMYFYYLLPLHATLILLLFIPVTRYIDDPVIYTSYLLDTLHDYNALYVMSASCVFVTCSC